MYPVDSASRAVAPPASTEATPPAELSPAQQQALAERYAPVLYFHPDEQNFLQDPNTYLEESSLRQERDFRGDKELHGEGDVPPEELADIGPENADADGQTFLDHSDSDAARAGDLSNSKNLYQYDTETNTVTYFFFYAHNDGPPGVGDVQNHEGDWERMTVQLDDQYQPTEVRYSAHEGMDTSRAWADAPQEDGRPVVYVGQGSHASYPETGEWSTNFPGVNDQVSAKGIRFDTAGQPPVDVTTQPWYGSHVLWGERGSLQEFGQGATTGPTGPSPEKGPVGDVPPAEGDRGPTGPERSTSHDEGFSWPPLPGLPSLPDIPGIPDLPRLPDIDLPDLPDPRDIDLPDIDVPDIDLPDLPDPRDIELKWPL